MKKNLMFFCLLVLPTVAVQSESRWVDVVVSKSGSVWSVDATSIKDVWENGKAIRKAWIKIDNSRDKTIEAREEKAFVFFDCALEKIASTTWILYRSNGSVLRDISKPYPVYQNVVPETVSDQALETICNVKIDN